jgi:UDP-glucuronate decarboxylase
MRGYGRRLTSLVVLATPQCQRKQGGFQMGRLYDSRNRILVTGGAGFLGSHLGERLLEMGHEIRCADNLFTGTKRNIDHLHNHPRFELLRHDTALPLFVEVDEIYNFASPASPLHYQHDPVQTTKTSVHGAINMLGLAKRLKCRICQASTSEVYGDPSVHPHRTVLGQREPDWATLLL